MPINIYHQVGQSAVSFRILALLGVAAVFGAVLTQPSAIGHANGLNTTRHSSPVSDFETDRKAPQCAVLYLDSQPRPLLARRPAMQVNPKSSAAPGQVLWFCWLSVVLPATVARCPGDGAPGTEDPALIKMNNPNSEPYLPKPVCTHDDHRAVPYGSGLG